MIIHSQTESDGTTVFFLRTDTLDMSNAAAFREEVVPLLAKATGGVAVDCAPLEFVDSSGVGALLHINKQLPAEQRPLQLRSVGRRMLSLLEMMYLHRSFQIQPKAE